MDILIIGLEEDAETVGSQIESILEKQRLGFLKYEEAIRAYVANAEKAPLAVKLLLDCSQEMAKIDTAFSEEQHFCTFAAALLSMTEQHVMSIFNSRVFPGHAPVLSSSV